MHHGRGVHAFNYSDLPLWDMVFGTFRNPARFEGEVGFWPGASSRVGDLLLGRDVAAMAPPGGGAPARTQRKRGNRSRDFPVRHAEGGTRTRTGLRPLRPERSASTNSTTPAWGTK